MADATSGGDPKYQVKIDYRSLEGRVEKLVKKAQILAFREVKVDDQAKARILSGLHNRLKPYLLEAETIAGQLATTEYLEFRNEMRAYLRALTIVVACPDGRISPLSLSDARVAYFHRVLRGQLPTRPTTQRREVAIPANADLRADIWTILKRIRRLTAERARFVAFVGPHLDSMHPIHGCGAAATALGSIGSGLPAALATTRFGGARNYFRTLQASGDFYALDNFAHLAGADAVTIDYTHDLHSQGVIIGLGASWRLLRDSETLRENLTRLHEEGRLVMSELLTELFRKRVIAKAADYDEHIDEGKTLNYREPTEFAHNAMVIGRVAKAITESEEKKDFPLIPPPISSKLDSISRRVVFYHLIRNVAYQILGGIEPGKHWLTQHPEQVLRIGPIGAAFNVKTIAFIETAPPSFSQADMQSAFALYNLMERFLPAMHVDLAKEARVVMVTGAFNPDIYRDKDALEMEYDRVVTTVLEDASRVKMMVKRAIIDGAAVVIPMIHHAITKSVIDIV